MGPHWLQLRFCERVISKRGRRPKHAGLPEREEKTETRICSQFPSTSVRANWIPHVSESIGASEGGRMLGV